MRGALAEVLAVPLDALRLLGRHWPTLVTACLLGLAGRQGILWIAVTASDRSATLGVLLMPLASVCMMAALLTMLLSLRPSLPGLAGLTDAVRGHRRIASVMLPFLAVYASQGLLKEDARGFVRDATLDESLGAFLSADYSRVLIAEGWPLVALVLGALLLRRVILGLGLATRNTAWGLFATYLEALWMVTLGATLASGVQDLTQWLEQRRAWAWVVDAREQITAASAALGALIDGTVGVLGTFLGGAGALVVVPVAWLSIGALVYGTSLAAPVVDPPQDATGDATGAESTADASDAGAEDADRRRQAWAWAVAHARSAASEVVSPVTTPVTQAWQAFRKVAVAGAGPMVFFFLLFAATQQVNVLMAHGIRAAVGPREALLAMSLEPYYRLAERLVYFVCMVVLLAAAVNRVVASSAQRQDDVVGRVPAQA